MGNLGFSIMGDSISTLGGYIPEGWRIHYKGETSIPGVAALEDTWWGQVIAAHGGHLVANSSFSGSTIEGMNFPAGCSLERAKALLGANGETPDVVLVFMGINDFGWGGARNQVMGGSKSRTASPDDYEGPHEVLREVGKDALERFVAAYEQLLANIRTVAPQAEIWCLTLCPGTRAEKPEPHFMWKVRGLDLDQYNQAIRACCAAASAHVADVRSYGIDYDSVDDTHPSALGMRQISAMVCAQMGLEADLSVLDGAPQSLRPCHEPSCAGCQFNPNTPSSWSLGCTK